MCYELYEQIIQENLARGQSQEEAKQRAESPSRYLEAKAFFVP